MTDREIVNYGPNSVVFGAIFITVTLEIVLGFGVNGQRSSKSELRFRSVSRSKMFYFLILFNNQFLNNFISICSSNK